MKTRSNKEFSVIDVPSPHLGSTVQISPIYCDDEVLNTTDITGRKPVNLYGTPPSTAQRIRPRRTPVRPKQLSQIIANKNGFPHSIEHENTRINIDLAEFNFNISTQKPFSPVLKPMQDAFKSPCTDLSLVNESFLTALDSIERGNGLSTEKKSIETLNGDSIQLKIPNFENNNESQDMFSDLLVSPAKIKDIPIQLDSSNVKILNRSRSTSTNGKRKNATKKAIVDEPGPKKPAVKGRSKGKKKKGKFRVAYTNKKGAKLLSESGNKELSREDLTLLSEEERLLLSSWGLPSNVLYKYKAKGLVSLFPWQLECLSNEKVLEGCNLLYSAPTSAGKTLVAEILMIKRVLELGKKAIMILPFVSVAREKMYSLQELFGDAGVRVEGFMGSYNPPGGFKSVDIAICTIEKANSLINRLLEEGSLSQLGTIVVDEIHLLGDPHRGYLLELLLTKIKYMTMKSTSLAISHSEEMEGDEKSQKLNIQIVGMSATLPNLDVLAKWLNAELVTTDYRPVPLVERIKIEDNIYDQNLELIRPVVLDSLAISIPNDNDHVVYLCLETVLGGHSILIFCPSKKMCELTAEQIAREFYNIGNPTSCTNFEIGEKLRSQLNGYKIADVIAQLNQCPAGLDETLERSVAFGVAFHHAGLTFDERDILEASFKSGVLRVMVATSTLSAGVNLPARRVIIRTPHFNGGILDVLTYRQMSGRAGRKGVDLAGESLLMCTTATQAAGIKLIQSYLPAVKSALLGHQGSLTSSMKRAMLEIVASGVAHTPAQVHAYSRCTLLSFTIDTGFICSQEDIQSSQQDNGEIIEECLRFLERNDFIRLKKYESAEKSDEYMATQLGSACLASSLSPDEGIAVFKELQKARRCFVLENELHVVYQVTPIYLAEQWRNIDWHNYLVIWESLSSDERKVADLVGVEESFIVRAMTGTVSWRNPRQATQLSVHQRFFTSLALNDLVNEMRIGEVAEKYCVNKGVIQNLQQSASTFAGMVTVFCNRLGWFNLELLLSQFQERLQFGVQRELCDLVRLSLVNGHRARILYDEGVKTIAELAACEPAQIEQFLHKAGSFSSNVHGGPASKPLWVLGKNEGLSESEAARQIVLEARQFLQIELGLPDNLNYNSNKESIVPSPALTMEDRHSHLNVDNKNELVKYTSDESSGEESQNEIEKASTNAVDVEEVTIQNLCKLPLQSANSSDMLNEQLKSEEFENIESKSFEMNVFEDSFPMELVSSKNSEMKETGILNHQTLHKGKEENPSNISCNEQKHSTPLQNLCNENCQIENEHIKMNLHEMSFCSNSGDDVSKEVDNGSLSDILMESVTSQMDISLHISEQEPVSNLNPPLSEDLFPHNDEINQKVCGEIGTDCSSSSNEVLEGSPEDHSMKQYSHQRNQSRRKSVGLIRRILDEEPDDNFDLEFSNFKFVKHSFKPAQVRGRTIHIKIVDNPEMIPIEQFNRNQPIGMGMKLSPPKRISSLSRHGIGSKVVAGRSVSHSVDRPPNFGRRHSESDANNSIAIFDEVKGIIWIFQWTHTQALYPNSGIKTNVARIFRRIQNARSKIVLLDAKEKLKKLFKFCGHFFKMVDISSIESNKTTGIWDPKIAEWLVQTDDQIISLDGMVSKYMHNEERSIKTLRWPGEVLEAYWGCKLMTILREKLEVLILWEHFTNVEMACIRPLVLMEMNGFGFNSSELENLKKYLDFKSSLLELRAYQLAGRQFNLSSPKEIRQVLFREIGLKEPVMMGTAKDVLIKLEHELPHLIIEWRKVVNAIKMVIHFLQDRNLDTGRVHGCYSYFTVSGRVIMTEPSLQCIPRDFDLKISYSTEEIENIRDKCRIKFGSKLGTLLTKIERGVGMILGENPDRKINISMRNAFAPCSEAFVLMSADYSQLELRILAHLCGDENLLHVLNQTDVDVFKSVAAQWKKLDVSEVTTEMRQEAKAITYGIIYGMGSKALAEQMDIEEGEASVFISEFMRAYPKIRSFIDTTVRCCRENGFVETICGRKRFLGNITSKINSERAQAQRQAINFKIQGSASDLVKTAMTQIYYNFASLFPETMNPVEWKERTRNSASSNVNSNVCFPILNLHDELIFEVKESHLADIACKVKCHMETCLKLNVRLPVVVKTGKTWGTLLPYFILSETN